MTVVIRILEVDLNKFPRAVINLLIKSHRYLVGVNLFHVPGLPPLPPLDIEPISPSPRGEAFPMGKFPFILLTRTHRISIDPEASILLLALIPGPGTFPNSFDPETPFLGSVRRTVQDKRQSAEDRLGTQDAARLGSTQDSKLSTSVNHYASPSAAWWERKLRYGRCVRRRD
jgi:hypothetical protein